MQRAYSGCPWKRTMLNYGGQDGTRESNERAHLGSFASTFCLLVALLLSSSAEASRGCFCPTLMLLLEKGDGVGSRQQVVLDEAGAAKGGDGEFGEKFGKMQKRGKNITTSSCNVCEHVLCGRPASESLPLYMSASAL
jgi:hypothetical protein